MSYFIPQDIQDIASKLSLNSIGIFPCDTILGLIGRLDHSVVTRLQSLKNRQLNSPFLILIPDLSWLDKLATDILPSTKAYIQTTWPGPTTILLKKHPDVPSYLTAGKPTIAIRYADYTPLNYLFSIIQEPLLSTSVNLSQAPASLTPETIPNKILKQVDFTLFSCETLYDSPSKIVDGTTTALSVLRS